MKSWFFTVAASAVACSSPDVAAPATAPPPEPVAALPADACSTNEVPLALTYYDHVADKQLAPVTAGGVDGWLTLDTGSSLTFLYGPTNVTDRKPITIGCETFDVIQRDFAGGSFRGKPILGVLGADFLITKTAELDYPGKRIVRYAKDAPPDAEGYLVIPWEDASGHIGVRAEIDGTRHMLLFDTGAGHAMLGWTDGRPGDQEIAVVDVNGDQIRAFLGESTIAIAGETKRAPVLRIPHWPYYESYAKTLHPEMEGLFGRTALGFRRVIFDPKAHVMRAGPIVPTP